MFRKKLGIITAILFMTPVIYISMMDDPDLSGEQSIVEGIADLKQRLGYAEMLNREHLTNIIFMAQRFNVLTQIANTTLPVNLSKDALQLLRNQSLPSDLHLPSIYSYMPHLLKSFDAVSPAFKLSQGRTSVDIVLGVPTVKREVQSYLMTTLKNLIDAMYPDERDRCLIVVLVAEPDLDYVNKIVSQVERKFSEHVESGLIEVIAPPASFYPNFTQLKQTLGDPMERVRWRTKQNLDYSFLMMYAQPKGVYYVQLEDDIQTKKGFINTMKSFALRMSAEKKDWIVLDFCQLGFIGKFFKTSGLDSFVTYLLIFNQNQPCDWLLYNFVANVVCRLDRNVKMCKKAKDNVWIHYKPSIFQHIGTHSSLKGKVQKLKDKQYGKVVLHFPHNNPPAQVKTTIKHYKQYTFENAYKGQTFFWGLLPQKDDTLLIRFTPPVFIKKFLFRSGNVEHPSDRFYNTSIEINLLRPPKNTNYKITTDQFYVVGAFDDTGLAENIIPPSLGKVQELRLYVHVESENWAILSEIFIQTEKR